MDRLFEKSAWEWTLRKYPDLREVATSLGVVDNPKEAKRIFASIEKWEDRNNLGKIGVDFYGKIKQIEFKESQVLDYCRVRGTMARNAGGFCDDVAFMTEDAYYEFLRTYDNWKDELGVNRLSKCPNLTFEDMYTTYLSVIQLQAPACHDFLKQMFIRHVLMDSKDEALQKNKIEMGEYFEAIGDKNMQLLLESEYATITTENNEIAQIESPNGSEVEDLQI